MVKNITVAFTEIVSTAIISFRRYYNYFADKWTFVE